MQSVFITMFPVIFLLFNDSTFDDFKYCVINAFSYILLLLLYQTFIVKTAITNYEETNNRLIDLHIKYRR